MKKEVTIRKKRVKPETSGENLCRRLVWLADEELWLIDQIHLKKNKRFKTPEVIDKYARKRIAGQLQQAAEELLKAYIVSRNEKVKHYLQSGTYYRKCLKLNNEFSKLGCKLKLLRDYTGDSEYAFRRELSCLELQQIVIEMKELYFFEEIEKVRKNYMENEKYQNFTKKFFDDLAEKAKVESVK